MARFAVAADLTVGCTAARSITTSEAAARPSMVTGPSTARKIDAKTVIAKTAVSRTEDAKTMIAKTVIARIGIA